MERNTDRPIIKRYYKIGEVAAIVDVPTSTVRHWETEFEDIRPRRSKMMRNGNRIYSPKDLATLQLIRRLLYVEGYTILGAKKRMLNDAISIGFKSVREMIAKEVCHGFESHRAIAK